MEILASLLGFQAFVLGVVFLGVLAGLGHWLRGDLKWLNLLAKVSLYATLAIFLFFSYSFLLGAAIAVSYSYFILVFTALFGFTSFILPRLIARFLGDRTSWFTRSLAAFGFAIVLLLFGGILFREVGIFPVLSEWLLVPVALLGLFWYLYPKVSRSR
jgi:hypothetical protein